MTTLIVLGIILFYLGVAAFTFGYYCGKNAEYYDRYPNWYYDEPGPWFAAIFWPIYIGFSLFAYRTMWFLVKFGEKRGSKRTMRKRIRVDLEKKIRVEQERIEQEAKEEVEAALRLA